MSTQPPDQTSGEAVPLPEQDPKSTYTPSPEVEALTPKAPEVLSSPSVAPSPTDATIPSASSTPVSDTMLVVPPPSGAPEGVGGILLTPDALLDQEKARSLSDAFGAATAPRVSSRDLFKPEVDQPPNNELLKQFVTTQRIRDLWNQIDALQEEVIQNVQADRSNTDTYQQDLLYASSLLLQNAGNYDEARQIVYRIRGDLNRERRVSTDTRQYRPIILIYYGVWLVITVISTQFDPQFRQLVPDNLSILKLAFLPMLFAVFGSLVNGVMALNEHTTLKRDFDPVYLTWYLLNPLIGGLLGLVVFVLFVVTGSSFTPNLISDQNISMQQTPVIWLLAFIVGWQQNTAVRLLNGFLKTVSSTTDTTTTTSDTSASAQTRK